VLTYTGASVHNNQVRPPAVPLEEMLDAVDALAPDARSHVVRRHPLQPFDADNFEHANPVSFDRAAADAARSLQGPRHRREPFLREPFLRAPIPAAMVEDIQLDDLRRFFRHPVGGFLRQGLDVGTPEDYVEPDDAMPVMLGGLDDWKVGDRILHRILGLDADQRVPVLTAELLRGDLPPRRLGDRAIEGVVSRVQQLEQVSAAEREPEPTSIDLTIDLGSGRRLVGVVPDVRGRRIVRVNYSRLAPKHRLEAWIDLLALTTALPDQAWIAVTYGWWKAGNRQEPACSILDPVEEPRDLLLDLVEVWQRGLREPLPLFAKSSPEWVSAVDRGKDPLVAASYKWNGNDSMDGEGADPAHVRVFGDGVSLERLLGVPRPEEDWNDEPTRLGRYAMHVWRPLLRHEKGKHL
jgi:exodeoxyribonuclease V gamma subunit